MLIKGLSAALVAATLLAPIAIAGPVDVNTADAKTLARELQGVGMAKAEAIVSYREKNGPFKSADDLAKVKGLGKKLIDQNKTNLKFESAKAERLIRASPRRGPAHGGSGIMTHSGFRNRRTPREPTRTDPFRGVSRRRARHTLPARHQGEPEGNAADRRQAAHPVRRGGSTGRGCAPAGVHHRQFEARHRGSFRHRPRTRVGARGAGQAGSGGPAARHPARRRHLHLHPPAGTARPRPCRAVRARGGRQRAFLRAPGRRPDRCRGAGARADAGPVPAVRRQRDRRAAGAAQPDRQLRHRGDRGRGRRVLAHSAHGREAEAGGRAFRPRGRRPLPALRLDFRSSQECRPRRGRRDPADRRHCRTARRRACLRVPVQGQALRLRQQARLPRGDGRVRPAPPRTRRPLRASISTHWSRPASRAPEDLSTGCSTGEPASGRAAAGRGRSPSGPTGGRRPAGAPRRHSRRARPRSGRPLRPAT